ncbi:hypothetical protein BH23PLA1_BH23PLA1_03670 [soil metagenome]
MGGGERSRRDGRWGDLENGAKANRQPRRVFKVEGKLTEPLKVADRAVVFLRNRGRGRLFLMLRLDMLNMRTTG